METLMDWCARVGMLAFIAFLVAVHFDVHGLLTYLLFLMSVSGANFYIWYQGRRRWSGAGPARFSDFLLTISLPVIAMITTIVVAIENTRLWWT